MVSKAFGLSQLGDTDSIRVDGSNNTLQITGNVTVSNTVTIAGNSVSPVQSFRNKVINGNFDFWQRGTSVTGVTNGQYLADRWVSVRVGTTADVSRQSFTLGQTDVPNEPTYFYRTVVTSVAAAGNLYVGTQRIESVRTLAGQTATLSFWAKADASKNMAVEFTQSFGTGGSPSSAVNAIGVTTCALTTAWKKFTITVSIPSISGKTLGSDNNDSFFLLFWFDAGSNWNARTNSLGQQSGTFDIAQVQLEAGPVATPFEVRPLGTELALCQRYYQTIGNKDVSLNGTSFKGYNVSSQYDMFFYTLLQEMRVSPTVTVIGTWSNTNCSQPSFTGATPTTYSFQIQITSTGHYVATANNSGSFTFAAEI